MSVYIISYDLLNDSNSYEDLYETIQSYGTWWHHLESVWLIESNDSASSIRDKLITKIKDNDKILVMKLEGSWATYNIKESGTNWLKDLNF